MRNNSYFTKWGLAFFAAVVLAEVVFWLTTEPLTGVPYLQPSADRGMVAAKVSLMPHQDGAIVLLGDSSCAMNLLPEIISGNFGVEVANLGALSSFTAAGIEALGKKVLQESKPAALIVTMLPQSLDISEQQAREFGLVGPTLVAYQMQSDAYTPSLRDWQSWFFGKHEFGRFPSNFGGSYQAFQSQLVGTRGFLPENRSYTGFSKEARSSVTASEFSLDALQALSSACKRQHVRLFFLWQPVPADSVTVDYVRQATSIAKNIEGIGFHLLHSPVPRLLPPRDFGTVTHLRPDAAVENTNALASMLMSMNWLSPIER